MPRSLSGNSSWKPQSPRVDTRKTRRRPTRQELVNGDHASVPDPEGTCPAFPLRPPSGHVTHRGGQRTSSGASEPSRFSHANQSRPIPLRATSLSNLASKPRFLRSDDSPIGPNTAVHQGGEAERLCFYWLFFTAIPASCRPSAASPGAPLLCAACDWRKSGEAGLRPSPGPLGGWSPGQLGVSLQSVTDSCLSEGSARPPRVRPSLPPATRPSPAVAG